MPKAIQQKQTNDPALSGNLSVILNPFDFLDGSLNMLVIEDDDLAYSLIEELFAPIRLFSVSRGVTTAQALACLRSGKRFHVCVMDLGMNDVGNDEFYILRQYANHCSIIVLTGSTSPEKGATCIQLGARAVVEKGANFSGSDFIRTVNRYAIINIVNHRYVERGDGTLSFATKILLEKSPSSVTEWADLLRISDRQLRNLWHLGLGFGAKYILYVYSLYKMAFLYYENQLIRSADSNDLSLPDRSGYEKLVQYYHSHREIITFLVS